MAAGLLIAAGWYWQAKCSGAPPAPPAAPDAAVFAPAAHSVAVLPFENLSGDRAQDYFSDGLSEELLNSLVTIRDLLVAARTSSFSFNGTAVDTATIARKLNVGALLDGSVCKQGTQVRISAQLINAVTGFNLWSKTYDRDLKDVLKVQTDVATAVTAALQSTLMGSVAAHVDLGGTENPRAFDAFLRGEKAKRLSRSKARDLEQIAAYDEAIRLDPKFARAYVGKAQAMADLTNYLSPTEGHEVISQAISAVRTAVELDPLNPETHNTLGHVLSDQRRYTESIAAFDQAASLNPGNNDLVVFRGLTRVAQGQYEAARADCETPPLNWANRTCLSIAYQKVHRQADAQAALDALTAVTGETASYQYAQIYVQWGNLPKALDWLETGIRIQDPGLTNLKVDPLLDPLRGEARFRGILAKLKFPD